MKHNANTTRAGAQSRKEKSEAELRTLCADLPKREFIPIKPRPDLSKDRREAYAAMPSLVR